MGRDASRDGIHPLCQSSGDAHAGRCAGEAEEEAIGVDGCSHTTCALSPAPRGRRGWKKFYAVLKGTILYLQKVRDCLRVLTQLGSAHSPDQPLLVVPRVCWEGPGA